MLNKQISSSEVLLESENRDKLIRDTFKSLCGDTEEILIDFKTKALELNSLEPVVKLDGAGQKILCMVLN
jgi:hypothetical protein